MTRQSMQPNHFGGWRTPRRGPKHPGTACWRPSKVGADESHYWLKKVNGVRYVRCLLGSYENPRQEWIREDRLEKAA